MGGEGRGPGRNKCAKRVSSVEVDESGAGAGTGGLEGRLRSGVLAGSLNSTVVGRFAGMGTVCSTVVRGREGACSRVDLISTVEVGTLTGTGIS